MFGDGALTFHEFAMKEPLPLARVHDAIFEFLRGREDAVVFGAQAVNAYVSTPRMTQDVDIMSTRAPELAEELRQYLNEKFHVAIRVRSVRGGIGYRVYQIQKPENRHLADVRPVAGYPPTRCVDGVLFPVPEDVIAGKVCAYAKRKAKAKGISDLLDLTRMLNQFPPLKTEAGAVADRLAAHGADEAAMREWREAVARQIEPEDEDDEFLE